MIQRYQFQDLKAIVTIFNYYVHNDACIFQMKPYTYFEIDNKFNQILKKYPILVARDAGKIIGFAYGSTWRDKPAYKKSVETTIYMHPRYKNRGMGKELYQALIDELEELNFHLLVACMTLPNEQSQRLHEKLGFKFVGKFNDAGMKFDNWHDVGFWQKNLPHK